MLWLVGDYQQVVLSPASGHPDVELVAAGRVGDSTEGGVDGEGLDAGLCGGVTQLEVFVGVAVGECHGGGAVEASCGDLAVGGGSGDLPAVTVADPPAVGSDDPAVVPAGCHDVTHPDGGVPLSQHGHAGFCAGVASCGDRRVDVGYETAGGGGDDGVLVAAGGPPVGRGGCQLGFGAVMHPAPFGVVGQRVDVAGA